MSKLMEYLIEAAGYTKNPAQFNKIVSLANTLFKELQSVPKMSGSDDKVFEIKARRLEGQCTDLVRAMKEKGKVRRA